MITESKCANNNLINYKKSSYFKKKEASKANDLHFCNHHHLIITINTADCEYQLIFITIHRQLYTHVKLRKESDYKRPTAKQIFIYLLIDSNLKMIDVRRVRTKVKSIENGQINR